MIGLERSIKSGYVTVTIQSKPRVGKNGGEEWGIIFTVPSKFYDPLLFGHLLGEVVYVTIGNPAFCLALYLTGVHF